MVRATRASATQVGGLDVEGGGPALGCPQLVHTFGGRNIVAPAGSAT